RSGTGHAQIDADDGVAYEEILLDPVAVAREQVDAHSRRLTGDRGRQSGARPEVVRVDAIAGRVDPDIDPDAIAADEVARAVRQAADRVDGAGRGDVDADRIRRCGGARGIRSDEIAGDRRA